MLILAIFRGMHIIFINKKNICKLSLQNHKIWFENETIYVKP